MGILIDRELGQQLRAKQKTNQKKPQTNSHMLSISRQEAGLFGNKQTIKKKKPKKRNEKLLSLKRHHNNSFHALLTFQPSFAAKMPMVSHSVYSASITALQCVHGILIFPTLLFRASALVYICLNSAVLEMHAAFFHRQHIEQPGDSSAQVQSCSGIGILPL